MRIGVTFPQDEIGTDPVAIRDYVQAAEDLGYLQLASLEHVAGAHPDGRDPDWPGLYSHESVFHEPMVLFAYMASATRRIEFFTNVMVLPQRQTALVAKQAAEVDVLSGGRLRLGLSVGWNRYEYEALNQDFSNRGRRIEEQIDVLRRLWTEEVVEYEGRWHRLDRVGINPLPVQRPIPIWMGGGNENVLKRVARIADGWFPQLRGGTGPYIQPGTPEAGSPIHRLRRYIQEAGRKPEDVGIGVWTNIAKSTPDDWQRSLAEWRGLGATHFNVRTGDAGLEGLDKHLDALRRFRESAGERAEYAT
jgi:probable F420-dependent oxidoreductase